MGSKRRAAVFVAMTLASIVVAASAGAVDDPSDGGTVLPAPSGETVVEESVDESQEPVAEGAVDEDPGAEEGHGEEPGEEPGDDPDHGNVSVRVCLATGDRESPYTAALAVTTDIIDGHGQVKTGGPADSVIGVFPAEVWGNIVPAVSHPSGATFAGLNMGTDGQQIWADGCGTDAEPEQPPPHEHDGVIICEASADVEVPYARVSVPATHIIKGNGQIVIGGPADTVVGVFPDEPWGSIVPPFSHPSGREFIGANWTELGETIWGADCIYVTPVPPVVPPPAPAPVPVSEPVLLDAPEGSVEPVVEAPEPLVPVNPVEPATVVPVDAPDAPTPGRPVTVSLPTAATLPTSVPAGGGAMANR